MSACMSVHCVWLLCMECMEIRRKLDPLNWSYRLVSWHVDAGNGTWVPCKSNVSPAPALRSLDPVSCVLC